MKLEKYDKYKIKSKVKIKKYINENNIPFNVLLSLWKISLLAIYSITYTIPIIAIIKTILYEVLNMDDTSVAAIIVNDINNKKTGTKINDLMRLDIL